VTDVGRALTCLKAVKVVGSSQEEGETEQGGMAIRTQKKKEKQKTGNQKKKKKKRRKFILKGTSNGERGGRG